LRRESPISSASMVLKRSAGSLRNALSTNFRIRSGTSEPGGAGRTRSRLISAAIAAAVSPAKGRSP